jgi:hypothetical protein
VQKVVAVRCDDFRTLSLRRPKDRSGLDKEIVAIVEKSFCDGVYA